MFLDRKLNAKMKAAQEKEALIVLDFRSYLNEMTKTPKEFISQAFCKLFIVRKKKNVSFAVRILE